MEDSLPGHLKELRRTLTRLRETAKQARRNLDQVRRLAYDADLIQIGIQQLVGERMMEIGNGSRWNKKRVTSIMNIMSLNYASLFVHDYSLQVPSYQDNVREKKE